MLCSLDAERATTEGQSCMAGVWGDLLDREVAMTGATGAVAVLDRADRAGMACSLPTTSTRQSVVGMTGLGVG